MAYSGISALNPGPSWEIFSAWFLISKSTPHHSWSTTIPGASSLPTTYASNAWSSVKIIINKMNEDQLKAKNARKKKYIYIYHSA